jgi:hypothetical protein
MNRREFFVRIGGSMVAVPMVLEAISCGDNNPTGANGTNWTVTSDTISGHAHTILLQCSQLTSSGDVMYTSSSANSHTHQVTLIPTQLASIRTGGSVTQASDADGTGHQHSWMISKPAGTC